MNLKTPEMLASTLLARVHEYVPLLPNEQLLLFYDDTVLSSAKAGLVVTDQRIVAFDKEKSRAIRIDDVRSVSVTQDRIAPNVRVLQLEDHAGTCVRQSVNLTPHELQQLLEPIRARVPPDAAWPGDEKAAAPRPPWASRVHWPSQGFVMSTTSTIEGRPARAYLGVVSGEAVFGANIISDFSAWVTDVFGGTSTAYENEFMRARETAFKRLEEAALMLGANAVVGIDVDYEVLGSSGAMMLVSVNGTAVVLADVVT